MKSSNTFKHNLARPFLLACNSAPLSKADLLSIDPLMFDAGRLYLSVPIYFPLYFIVNARVGRVAVGVRLPLKNGQV